ncbi:site-specific integrase [uncultured Tateyamaria sp.]|nr:site-specific integrase [uncultured Tateyamaria sp.]
MGEGPSFEQIDAAIKAYFQRALNWSLEFTDVLMDDPILDREHEAADMPEKIKAYKRQIASGQFSQDVLSDAQELLAPLLPAGDKADVGALRHASRGVLRARMEQKRRLIADLTGEYEVNVSGDPLFAGMSATDYPPFGGEAAQAQLETLQSIAIRYRAFKEVRGDAAKTLADFDVTMRLAYEVVSPEKPIHTVNDADVRALRDLIASVPPNSGKAKADGDKTLVQLAKENAGGPKLGFATQEKRLRFFRGMLGWASDEGYIDYAPGAKVSISAKKSDDEDREPYSKDDLTLMFKTPVYKGRHSATRSGTAGSLKLKDGKFWVPLISLYSGMRLGEIVQLLSSDVVLVDGVWVFDINRSEDEKKKVKTKTSVRKVPIHKTLIALGLLDHHANLGQGERLFSDLAVGANGYYSHNFSKWWGRYGKTFGFASKTKVFHSFRHSFSDGLRDVEAPEYVLKAIMGHSDKSVTSKYGHGASLAVRQSFVDKVQFDVVALHDLLAWGCGSKDQG